MARKTLLGTISSNKMTNTVIVKVEVIKVHPKYQKRFRIYRKYAAHTEDKYNIGDKVEIEEIKPMSKTKNWRVVKKI